MCNLRIEQARLVVCTHAHTDHCGQAPTIVERAGCELWMHPNHEHLNRMIEDPEAVFARRLEIARQSGVPEEPLRRYAAERSGRGPGIAGPIKPDRDLITGVGIVTDLGEWIVYETPGHSPSHVCFFQPERRLLVSGDHLLGRISLYFDYGYSPDPVGEFLSSLDVVERLGARLCLAGHGRTFTDVHAHIQGNRALVRERLQAVHQALAGKSADRLRDRPHVYGDSLSQQNAHWLLSKILCYLTHLQALGEVGRVEREDRAARGARAVGCIISGCASIEILAGGGAGVLVRVLPAQDPRRRAATSTRRSPSCGRSTRRSCRSPTAPAARPARRRSRSSSGSREELRPRGDGALHVRGCDRGGAARDARGDARARDRQRARLARRSACGRGGMDARPRAASSTRASWSS